MRQDKIGTSLLSRAPRLLLTTLLPVLGLALLILLMGQQPPSVRAGAANVWWVDGAGGSDGNGCLAFDDPCATINGAMEKAADGDLIHVAAGTYEENLVITKNLSFVGGFDANGWRARGDRSEIHPSGGGRVIKVAQNVTTSIAGFTLTGGDVGDSGPGLFANAARVTLKDSAVVDNHNRGHQWGGGVYFANSEAELIDVEISNNVISDTSLLANGGGIAIGFGSDVLIVDSHVISNSAAGGGGGIYVGDNSGAGSRLTLLRTEVLSNTAGSNGAGGLLIYPGETDASHLTMSGNRFQGNTSGGDGGALKAEGAEEGSTIFITATGNVMISNTATGVGGGWSLVEYVVASLQGDRFQGNTAAEGGGLYLGSVAITSTFEGLEFTSNQADLDGGGIFADAEVTFAKTELIGNQAGDEGGGLHAAFGGGPVTLFASRVLSNSAAMGGGVAGKNFEAYRVHLAGNQSESDGGGIGVQGPGAVVTVTNSVLAWNTTITDGGGLFFNGDEARIVNNTFVGDVSSSSHGIYLDLVENSAALVYNNVIVGQDVGVERATVTGSLSIGYNTTWDNGTDYVNANSGGSHAFEDDPQFVDRSAGDFHLTQSSGVRGSARSTYAPSDDYDGHSRPRASDGDDGGADEYRWTPSCNIDSFEDNNSVVNATSLGAGSYNNLWICPDDPDWYQIDVSAGATLQANLYFDQGGGDLDVVLLDEELRPVDAGHSSSNNEQVSVEPASGGTYYLHVYGVDLGMGGASNDYDLSIQISGQCSDDGYEENDDAGSAVGINSGSHSAQICPYDPDFYALTLAQNQIVTVTLSHVAADGDLDLWLYAPQGVYADASLTLSDQEQASFTTPPAAGETVQIRVCGYADGQCGATPVENDYDLDLIVVNNGPGVAMWPDRSANEDPGQTVIYQHTLRNDGNRTDTFTLQASSSRGWPVDVSTPPALAPGETATVDVEVTVPAGAPADVEDITTVTASSDRDPAYTAVVTDTTTVNYVANPTWDSAVTHNDVVPPQKIVYTHQLTNDGNADDTFDLEVEAPGAINASLDSNSLTISRGDFYLVQVTLDVAPYPTARHRVYDVTLRATSQRDGTSRSVVDHVDVNVQTGVTIDGPFSLEHARPLSTTHYSHLVHNTGNVTDVFSLQLTAPTGFTPTLGQDNLSLGPDASASVSVTLEVGAYPPVLSVTYPITLRAESDYNSGVNSQVTDQVQVDVDTGVLLDGPRLFDYTRPLSTVVYSHVLTNTGEFDDRFGLAAQAPSGITVTLSDEQFDLSPGGGASFDVTLEFGPYPQVISRTYGITLTAISDYDPHASAQLVDQARVVLLAGLVLDGAQTMAHTRPLSTVVYSHVLTNTGEFAETVALTATHPAGIAVSSSPDQLSLNPFESEAFSVTLALGPYPEVVSDTYDVTVRAQSLGNPDAKAAVVDQVSVDVKTGVALDGAVITSTRPLETVTYVHRLTNQGDVPDQFSLSLSAPTGITATLSHSQLSLGPEATQNFTVTLQIADYPTIVGGLYDVSVQAVSNYDATVNTAVVDQVEVIHYAIMLPLVLKSQN